MASSNHKKRIAIIGAGVSGLPAIKCVLEEDMIPVCFERTDDIGGLWNYKPEHTADGQATVMKSTVTSTSKERMAFSDFPVPDHFPNFLHNTKCLEYFRLYAKEFGLLKHIHFNTEVLKVDPTEDFKETGRWKVRITHKPSGEEKEEVFDGVMVCTGHHGNEHIPVLPGAENYKGRHLHSRDYKDYQGFEDKRVVVVGIGNSGGDIAVELGNVAKQVYIATRRGAWVRNRLYGRGLPYDMIGSRFTWSALMSLPDRLLNFYMMLGVQRKLDHEMYGLRPDHPVNAQQCMINDDLPNRIINGSIILKHGAKRLTETGVEFEDGSIEDNIDVVIYATGYLFKFPFIDESIFKVTKNRVKLYKFVFPPDLKPGTLCFIGCFQPVGSMMPLCEMQCRWATRVLKGTESLPSASEMWEDVIAKDEAMKARYVESLRHTIQVDWIPYFDDIADLIGCKPDFKKLWTTDPRLAYQVYFGSATPYQYRLFGPHPWPGARRAIMTTWKRVYAPLQTRKLKPKKDWGFFEYAIIAIIVYLVLTWIF